jgi:hypothetical protein
MRFTLFSLLLLAACTSHEVRCDAHLIPINLPTPVEAPGVRVPAAPASTAEVPVGKTPATATPAGATPATAAPMSAPQPGSR